MCVWHCPQRREVPNWYGWEDKTGDARLEHLPLSSRGIFNLLTSSNPMNQEGDGPKHTEVLQGLGNLTVAPVTTLLLTERGNKCRRFCLGCSGWWLVNQPAHRSWLASQPTGSSDPGTWCSSWCPPAGWGRGSWEVGEGMGQFGVSPGGRTGRWRYRARYFGCRREIQE